MWTTNNKRISTLHLVLLVLLTLPHYTSTLNIHPSAIKFTCPTTPSTPTLLSTLPKGTGDGTTSPIYLLLPTVTNTTQQLCTLTRVDTPDSFNNNNNPQLANFRKVYIPIARSYTGGPYGNTWQRVRGKYIHEVSINPLQDCGIIDLTTNEYGCQLTIPPLKENNEGYYLTLFQEDEFSDSMTRSSRFLEHSSFGATYDEITSLSNQIDMHGNYALAKYIHDQIYNTPITSHRAYFRRRLNPRAVESYVYGIPGPMACKQYAKFRRFAFTHKDTELSRGYTSSAGGTGLPMTPMEYIKQPNVNGGEETYYILKFQGETRTILTSPLRYDDSDGSRRQLQNGNYTICSVEETVGTKLGTNNYEWTFQLYVNGEDRCYSSYTNRDNIQDNKGDGSYAEEDIRNGADLVRVHDSKECTQKCTDRTKVKYILGGNPAVSIPDEYNELSDLNWMDLSDLTVGTYTGDDETTTAAQEVEVTADLMNLTPNITHDSNWILTKDLDTCTDENGNDLPDPAGLSNTDYRSFGRGKYNMDKPVFIKMPPVVSDDGNVGPSRWAIHDLRTQFIENTVENPKEDGGGSFMKRAGRSGLNTNDETKNNYNESTVALVTRCTNTQRNVFNEQYCKISYDENACVSNPLPDPNDDYLQYTIDPGDGQTEPMYKFEPSYAGPNKGGVVICGSPNEIAPNPYEDDTYDVQNRKVQSNRIDYINQKRDIWVESVIHANDQACQRLGFNLHKIFATQTEANADNSNTETNVQVLDGFVRNCWGTYGEVMRMASFMDELAEQLTFLDNKAVAADWHEFGIIAFPDQNVARENLQLHTIRLNRMDLGGVEILDEFGVPVPTYIQKNIASFSRIWTGFLNSVRRGNNEEQDWSTKGRIDPLRIPKVKYRDFWPKIDLMGGYIGDQYPLCIDLPKYHFLKKFAKYRLLGGSSLPLAHEDPPRSDGDPEVKRMRLDPESKLYSKLCNPKNLPLPSSTLTTGTGIAEYSPTYGAPFCEGKTIKCTSGGTLLKGRIDEENKPNTIDSCTDGTNTVRARREAVNKVEVMSIKDTEMRGGDVVKILATVEAYSICDRVDFYFASDVSPNTPVSWKLITIVAPEVPNGESSNRIVTVPYRNNRNIQYTLPPCFSPEGCQHAVRVVLRSGRDPADPNATKCKGRTDGDKGKPSSNCPDGVYDDIDDLVFEVLPSQRAQDTCDFQTIVELDKNLNCYGEECYVDTVRVVEVVPGTFYEYLHVPCVFMTVYEDPAKVFGGWMGNKVENVPTMCANKKWPSAMSTCCGGYEDREPIDSNILPFYLNFADVLVSYRFERLTYEGNKERCAAWGRRRECNPKRIGFFNMKGGYCLNQGSQEVYGGITQIETYNYHWTSASCRIQVKVLSNGLIAIVHDPDQNRPIQPETPGAKEYPEAQSHVHPLKTISFFNVWWDDSNVQVGKLPYPSAADNECDGGIILPGPSCLCDTTLEETAVFGSTPTRDEVFSLRVGAHNPSMFDEGEEYVIVGTESVEPDGVTVYRKNNEVEDFTTETVFRVMDENSRYRYLKNVRSIVRVCNGAFSYKNGPTFFDVVDPEVISADHETEALFEHVMSHPNVPPSVCLMLLQYSGYSDPTPHHVAKCSAAFISGNFTFSSEGKETLEFGDGRRGHLGAVTASILLNEDAISPAVDQDPGTGAVLSPLHKLMKVLRGLKLKRTPHHKRTDGLMNDLWQDKFGESPHGMPSTFSFYSLFYSPAGAHRAAGLVAPEAELLPMSHMIASQNAYYSVIGNGLNACDGGVGPNYYRGTYISCGNQDGELDKTAGYLSFAPLGDISDETNVVGQLSTLLTSNRINPSNREKIEATYKELYDAGKPEKALKSALALMVSIAEFHTTNKVALTDTLRMPTPPDTKNETLTHPYRAIVSLNLFGGADTFSMLTPHPNGCSDLYNEYKIMRGASLTLQPSELFKIDASTSEQPCTSFGVNSILPSFKDMYNRKEGIFFANIGHLNKPVNRYNFQTETTAQLFSHEDMREESFKVDAFNSFTNTGILGRMNDRLSLRGVASSQISIDQNSNILVGDATLSRTVDIVSRRGTDQFFLPEEGQWQGGNKRTLTSTMNEMNTVSQDYSSFHAEVWSQSFVDSQNRTEAFREVLTKRVPPHPSIPDTRLGTQMNVVYQLITAAAAFDHRKVNRDAFAVEMGGYDQHFSQKEGLNPLFKELDDAVEGFRKALKSRGILDKVTLLIHSEFGRTLSPNGGGGSDHGWGGNYFLAGGDINGGKVLGHYIDTFNPDSEYMTGRSVPIPTTSNDAMWFGLGQWYGILEDEMSYVLPNLGNFGCDLYPEKELFKNGTLGVPRCGGDIVRLKQLFQVDEGRYLTSQEQKDFGHVVVSSMEKEDIPSTCVILEQTVSTAPSTRRILEEPDLKFNLEVFYTVTSDQTNVKDQIVATVNTQKFQIDAASILKMNAVIQPAEPEPTNAPTLPPGTPTQSPTAPPPTLSPTTPKPTIPSFLGYEYVGEGECRDDSTLDEGTYDYVPFESSTPDDCPGKCATYYWDDNLGFRGFEFTTNPASTCKCLFDDGVEIPGIQQSTSSPSAQGEIFQVKESSTDTTCYKKATTVEPPVDVAGYEYIGFGACLNDSNQRYNSTAELSDATNLVECGEGCASVADGLADVIGFWGLEDNFCTCLLNAPDATPNPTSAPSTSPSKAPSAIITPTAEPQTSPPVGEVISLETNVQLNLIGMISVMDGEAKLVFENECALFLDKMMRETMPPIFDAECDVTNQQPLLSGTRRLESTISSSSTRGVHSDFGHRYLQEQSLQADVNVKGSAFATGTMTEPSDIQYSDMVYWTFAIDEKSAEFVQELKGVRDSDFSDLEEIKVEPVNDGGGSTTSTTSTASPPTTGSKSTKGRKSGKKGKGTATAPSPDTTTAKSSSKSSKTSSKSRRGLMEKQEQGQLNTFNTNNTHGSTSGKGFRRRTTATTRSGPTKSDFSEGYCYKIISGAAAEEEAALATKSNTLNNEREKKFDKRHRTRIHKTLPDWIIQEQEMEE